MYKAFSLATGKFFLGQLVMTSGVNNQVAECTDFSKFVFSCLVKHTQGDWGNMSPGDKKENDLALKVGRLRIFSSYETLNLPKIWIITEADRSATTILFPNEY